MWNESPQIQNAENAYYIKPLGIALRYKLNQSVWELYEISRDRKINNLNQKQIEPN